MDTKGRKLLRCVAGIMTAVVLMGSAYATTAMASGIGLIDTADLLDVHAEASDSSDVVGQVMDEGHVAILGRADGWVQIKAGDIIGWVPESNLIETEVSNEEAYEANEKVVAEFAEDVIEALEEEQEINSEEEQAEENTAEQDSEAKEQAEEGSEADGGQEEERNARESEAQEKEILDAQELAEEQARILAEAQKQAEEQAEAFAREQEKAAAAAQKLAEEQAEAFAREQEKAAAAVQKLAEEQARAAEALAQKQAQEAAKAAELAQKQAEQEAISQEALNAANVSAEDLELLASIIYCEAKGEPYIGKVAVGNVVLNRVKSSKYPNTIKGVIYAKGQFSPVKNGSMAKALRNDSADASCYQAALEALAGADPVGSKTSFRRVNGRSGQVIGHHVFY